MPPKGNKRSFRTAPLKDQIDILVVRASELSQKQTLKSLNDTLKAQPALLPGVVRYLEGLGIDIQTATELGKKRVKPTIEDDSKEGESSEQPEKIRKGKRVEDSNSDNWISRSYTRLDNTSTPFLEEVVSAVLPVVCSKYALKGLRATKNSSVPFKTMLLEILEYATGFDVSTSLKGDLRHKPTLTSHLTKLSDERNSRASNLCLPPVWSSSKDGIFELKETEEGCISVVDKTKKCSRLLSVSKLHSHFGSDIKFKDLCINNNFSEVRASIGCEETAATIPIASLPEADEHKNHANQQ